jgi:hypothetical protein
MFKDTRWLLRRSGDIEDLCRAYFEDRSILVHEVSSINISDICDVIVIYNHCYRIAGLP